MIISHVKIIVFQTIIMHCLWIFYIARKDCSLYNKLVLNMISQHSKSDISAHPCINFLYNAHSLGGAMIYEGNCLQIERNSRG